MYFWRSTSSRSHWFLTWSNVCSANMLSSLICLVTLAMMPTCLIVTQIKTWSWLLGIILLPPYHSSTTLRPENLANFPYLYTSWNFHIDTQNDALENVSLFNYPFSYYYIMVQWEIPITWKETKKKVEIHLFSTMWEEEYLWLSLFQHPPASYFVGHFLSTNLGRKNTKNPVNKSHGHLETSALKIRS